MQVCSETDTSMISPCRMTSTWTGMQLEQYSWAATGAQSVPADTSVIRLLQVPAQEYEQVVSDHCEYLYM